MQGKLPALVAGLVKLVLANKSFPLVLLSIIVEYTASFIAATQLDKVKCVSVSVVCMRWPGFYLGYIFTAFSAWGLASNA